MSKKYNSCREREDNWKETVEIMRTTFSNSPIAKIGDRLSSKTVKSGGGETNADWKTAVKDSVSKSKKV